MDYHILIAMFAGFSFGYVIAFSAGRRKGQTEGINFAARQDRERRMAENFKNYFRRDGNE